MALVKHIRLGFRSYVEAVKLVARNRMWAIFIAPLLMFGGIYYFGFWMQENELAAKTQMKNASFFVYIWNSIKWLFYLSMSFLSLQLTRYLMLMILSPVLAYVSEKVEKVITGNTYKLNLKQLWKDVRRAVRIAFRNMIYEIVFVMAINFIIWSSFWIFGASATTVPGLKMTIVDLLQLMVTSVVAFYFYGFGFLDYVMERRRMSVRQSIKFVRKHKGVAIALGSVFVFLFHSSQLVNEFDAGFLRDSFKWVTAILASTIPIFTAVAATLAMHELVDLSTSEYATRQEIKELINESPEHPELPNDLEPDLPDKSN